MRIKYTRISQLVTNSGAVRKTGRGVEESDLGVVTNACVILEDGRVSFAGFEADAPDVSVELERDLENKIVMPGFIDAQTRTVHGGDRFHEFALRATGMDDARIDAAGGGFRAIVRATRSASAGDLADAAAARLEEARAFGSALVEAKSGYGLTVADEIKMLEAAAAAGKKARVRVLPTLYASNASPPDQTGSDAWVRAIAEDLIPEAATRRLARAVCVRVGDSGFAPDDVRAIASAARAHDLPLRLRLSAASRESVELALELGAHAIEFAGDLASAAPCAESVIVSPVDHFLRGYERADLRGLIDAGACLALSTGTEPGFGRACSMPFAIALACKRLGLSVAESIVAATYGAARALGVDDEYGAIVPGRRTPLLAIDLPSWEALPYAIADIPRAQLIG